MLSNEYKVYAKKNIDLARSICVKSQQTIEAITQYLQSIGIIVEYVAATDHKYYVNLQGEYWNVGMLDPNLLDSIYTSVNDQMMYFTSIDTGAVVELTKANLSLHPNSKRELREFGEYYKNIVFQWPKQEVLIRRIIDPVTIPVNEIEEMEDGTILFYDERFVESNELNLIQSIQQWIYSYFARWNLIAFQNSDELYAASWLAIFYLNLTMTIISTRLENIKTNEVHSFHLWNYLGSYFYLDRFQSAITKDQALFLYRNMEYILHNAGNKSNLLLIYENMIKDYGLELNAFEIRQHSDNLPSDLRYTPVLNKYPIDSRSSVEGRQSSTVDRLIRQMDNSAVLNTIFIEDNITNLEESIKHSSSNTIETGVIEAKRENNVIEGIVNRQEEIMKYWFWFALNDRFSYQFILPITEEKDIAIDAKQAVYLLIYCARRYSEYYAHNTTNNSLHNSSSTPFPLSTDIPDISVAKLLNYDASITLPEDLSSDLSSYLKQDLQDLHNDIYGIFEIYTIDELRHKDTGFINRVVEQRIKHFLMKNHYSNLYSQMEASRKIDTLLYRHYIEDSDLSLDTLYENFKAINTLGYETWEEFLSEIQFFDTGLTIAEYEVIIDKITKEFIGETKVNEGMMSPYFEMMEILRILSSYTVTIIPSEASGLPKTINLDKHKFKLLNFTMNFLFNFDNSVPTFSINKLEITDNLLVTTTEPNRTVYPQLNIQPILLP